MKMTRHNFGELLTPVHKKVFFDELKTLPKEYTQIAWEFDMSKKEESFPHMGALGMWQENNEGNTINESEINQGHTAKLVARRFDNGYEVTWELVRDDLYNVMKGLGRGGSAAGLAYGLNTRVEQEVADIINNGFANVGYDGVALFSATHPLTDSGKTNDNLATGALDPDNLKLAMTKMRKQLNPAGLKIALAPKQLIVGPDNEFTALEILHSSQVAYKDENTKNVITGLRPVVMNYIEGNTWVLRDPSLQNIAVGWRDRVIFDSEKIPKTMDHFFYGAARFDVGYVSYMGLVGSTGNA